MSPEIGVEMLAAHFFVFYFGIVADITPPVALAAYAGAAIAKAGPMKTAFNASRLAIAAFIVPYIIAMNPAMLFINTTIPEVVMITITSIIGIFGVAAGLSGFVFRNMKWWEDPLHRWRTYPSGTGATDRPHRTGARRCCVRAGIPGSEERKRGTGSIITI